jgi:hypothetical protein
VTSRSSQPHPLPEQAATLDASPLLAALERAWAAIRARHPQVPAAIIVLASGTQTKAAKLGHFATGRWTVQGNPSAQPEVLVAGEGLGRGAAEVLATLLHEAAHGLCWTRRIRDTSRGGRYHNRAFRQMAEHAGLVVTHSKQFGFAHTTLGEQAQHEYAATIADLAAHLRLHRHGEPHGASTTAARNLSVACCGCPRKIRVAPATLAAAPILCGACHGLFVLDA